MIILKKIVQKKLSIKSKKIGPKKMKKATKMGHWQNKKNRTKKVQNGKIEENMTEIKSKKLSKNYKTKNYTDMMHESPKKWHKAQK